MNCTSFSLQAESSSVSMGREASEIWVLPSQKASKPSLVPAPPISNLTSGSSWPNNSEATCVMGCTVLEPSTATVPVSPPLSPPLAPPHAETSNDNPNRKHDPTNNLGRAIPLNPYTPFCRTASETSSQGGMI